MSCERYWREGIVLVERGMTDPHRGGCEDCTRAHASRQELIEALPLIGVGDTGDPYWQAKVWECIDGKRSQAPRPWRWQLAGALAIVCVVILWIGLGRTRSPVEIIDHGVAMRSSTAHVDDRVRVTVGEASDVWIYRADRLVLRCGARQASSGCAPNAHGMVAELLFSAPAVYSVIMLHSQGKLVPRGTLDDDLAALESAGVPYKMEQVSVR